MRKNRQTPDFELMMDGLRGYLQNEAVVSPPRQITFGSKLGIRPAVQQGVDLTVTVRNEAPPGRIGGQLVFTGVSLRIVDGRTPPKAGASWLGSMKKDRPSDQGGMPMGNDTGVRSDGKAFDAVAPDEQSKGEVLFPGESVVYRIQAPAVWLPSLAITVEGSISSRHLFQVVQLVNVSERRAEAEMVELFQALSEIGIHQPLLAATAAALGVAGTVSARKIATSRRELEQAVEAIAPRFRALNEVFHVAPHPEISDHIKQVVGRYMVSVDEAIDRVCESLSSGDIDSRSEAVDGLNLQMEAAREVDRKTAELMRKFSVKPEEAGFVPIK